MRRHLDFAQNSRKFLAVLLIAFWLVAPAGFGQAEPDFHDGFEQDEPW